MTLKWHQNLCRCWIVHCWRCAVSKINYDALLGCSQSIHP